MTQRERSLLIVFLAIIGLGGGYFILNKTFLSPLREYNKQVAALQDDVGQKERQYKSVMVDKMNLLNRWQPMSLPTNPDKAIVEYKKYLDRLLKKNGLEKPDVQPPAPVDVKAAPAGAAQQKKAGHIVLAFRVKGNAKLTALAGAMKEMQETPVMHRVKSLTLTNTKEVAKGPRVEDPTLNYEMVVEAMIVNNALRSGDQLISSGASTVKLDLPKDRNYASLKEKNVFTGNVPPPEIVKGKGKDPDAGLDMKEYVQLVSTDPTAYEAHLRNRIVDVKEARIGTKPGYEKFRIMDEKFEREQLKAKVLRVDQREVYFMVDEDAYAIRVGQTIGQAMRKALTDAELTRVGLLDVVYQELDRIEAEKKKKGEKTKGDNKKGPGKKGKS